MTVHVRGEPGRLLPRLRSLAAAIDPTLRFHEVVTMDTINDFDLHFLRVQFWLVTIVSGGAMLLSLAGIFSVLSFTISQRTSEIGVRLALGGPAARVAATILRRPLAQVGLGMLVGTALTVFMVHIVNQGLSAIGAGPVIGYVAVMIAVCSLAAIVPIRRALRIEPTEALKSDG